MEQNARIITHGGPSDGDKVCKSHKSLLSLHITCLTYYPQFVHLNANDLTGS